MTIEERIEQFTFHWGLHPDGRGHKEFDNELKELLEQLVKEQDRNTRHESVEILTNHVYSWQEKGGKLTDPEFLNRLQSKLMNMNAPSPLKED